MNRSDKGLFLGILLLIGSAVATAGVVLGWFALAPSEGGWIVQYQTLLAGVLAGAAGFGTIWTSIRLAERDRRRDLAAARAVLPLALKETCDYSAASALYCADQWRAVRDGLERTDAEVPVPPHGEISVYKDCIRSAEEPFADRLARIVRKLQIQSSRLQSISRRRADPAQDWTLTVLVDSAELHALCESLFEFARGASQVRPEPIDQQKIRSALNNIFVDEEVWWEDDFEFLSEKVDEWSPDRWSA